jgi:uncharacterized protein (TIGR00369 family)
MLQLDHTFCRSTSQPQHRLAPLSPTATIEIDPMPITVAAAQKILDDLFAPWVLATGIRVEATTADTAMLRIPFDEKLCRVGGMICGQTLVTGADTAMVIALAAAMGDAFRPVPTIDLTINYMRPVSFEPGTGGDALLAAKVLRLGKTLAFCTCEISDARGRLAAFSTGTYAIPAAPDA